jgi:hypothetical protein
LGIPRQWMLAQAMRQVCFMRSPQIRFRNLFGTESGRRRRPMPEPEGHGPAVNDDTHAIPVRRDWGNPDGRMLADAAYIALAWYDNYLEENPIEGEIRDENCLPFPKDVLIRAVEVELAGGRNPDVEDYLIDCGLKLALFRSGIGNRPVRRQPHLVADSFGHLSLRERLVQLEHHHRICADYHDLMAEVMVEMDSLLQRFQRALRN